MIAAAKSPNRLRISIVDLTFIIWVFAIPLALGRRALNADGDLPRHLTMGEFVLRNGFGATDAFAYTHTGPYEGMEWLSQVTFALVHRLGGLAAVLILTGIVIAAAFALIVMVMRRAGVDPLLAYLVGTTAAIGASVHMVGRPHIFTFLFLTLLLYLMEFGTRRRVWLFVPLFALWANLHGMFALGLAILGAWSAGALLEAWQATDGETKSRWLGRARHGTLGIALGLTGAMLNPRGAGVFAGVTSCLGDSFIFQNTNEFQSLNFQTLYGRLVMLLVLGIMALLAVRRDRVRYPRLLVVLLLLAGGLTSGRMMPLFMLVALPLLAVEFDTMWRQARLGRHLEGVRRVFSKGEDLARPGRFAPAFGLIMLALAPLHGRVGNVQLVPDAFAADFFPVAAVEWARANNVDGRILNDFVWGGYILYAWPEQRIYIDGMTCFLGSDVMRSYLKIYWLDPGWREEMQQWGMTLALVPPKTRIAAALLESGEWTTRYRDDTAVLLERTSPWEVAGEPVAESVGGGRP
jgi:hypothetical protein